MESAKEDGNLKTIWIIDHYSSEPVYGGISRQYDFARELGKRGYKVIVIASGFSHFTHEYITEKGQNVKVSKTARHVRYIYIKTSRYETNGGIGRAGNMVSFMVRVMQYGKIIADKYGKPDVVTGCSVHPLAWVASYQIAHKYKARFIAEVRDFWPRIWVAGGDKKKTAPVVLLFSAIQGWIFQKADKIIYSMYHGDKYLCGELGISPKKVYLIGQPMDCKRFDANSSKIELLPDKIREFLCLDNRLGDIRPFICTFTGYYMVYEGVYVMLEALKLLEAKNLPIKMVFAGSGREKEGMERYIKKNHLKNALVYDRIQKEAVPALLVHSDICMAHLEVQGHKDVYKYGVSKNKVNEYLYSGACTLYGFLYKDDEVAASGGGMIFEPYNAKELAEKIEKVYRMRPAERMQFGKNGRAYIKSSHSVEVLTDKMAEVLFG